MKFTSRIRRAATSPCLTRRRLRHADFVREYAKAFGLGEQQADRLEDQIERFIANKQPGEVDSAELQKIKGLIRRTEARAGARFSGAKDENIHFMDLPFYETGRVRKQPLGEEDIKITMDLLEKVKPHQIYAAGDLSDPHGTHRVCLSAIIQAIGRLKDRDWMKTCEVWLYRGAWQEWGVDEIEMAVRCRPTKCNANASRSSSTKARKTKPCSPQRPARILATRRGSQSRDGRCV